METDTKDACRCQVATCGCQGDPERCVCSGGCKCNEAACNGAKGCECAAE